MLQLPESLRELQPQKAVSWWTVGPDCFSNALLSLHHTGHTSEGTEQYCTLTNRTFQEGLCLEEHWSSLWVSYSLCVETVMMTPLMVLAEVGRKIMVSKRRRKGCRMTRGAARWREVQPEVTGWGWETQMEWLPCLLCVCKSVCAAVKGKCYIQTTSQTGYKL